MGGNTSELNNTQWKELVSDKLFHAVLNHMPDALHCCNSGEGYSFLWMSDGFCGLTGYSREELQQLFDNRLIVLIHEEDREGFRRYMSDLIDGKQGGWTDEGFVCRMQAKDATLWIRYCATVAPVEGENYIQGTIVDVTRYITESRNRQKALCQEKRLKGQYKSAITSGANFVYEVNVTTDTLEKISCYVKGEEVPYDTYIKKEVPCSYSEYLDYFAEKAGKERIKDTYRMHTISYIRQCFAKGIYEWSVEYETKTPAGREQRIRRQFVLTQDEETGEVHALIIGKEVSAMRMMQIQHEKELRHQHDIIKVLAKEYSSIFEVDKSTRRAKLVLNDSTAQKYVDEIQFYSDHDDIIAAYCNVAVYTEDVQQFVEDTAFEKILEELEAAGEYEIRFRRKKEDGFEHMQLRYIWEDENRFIGAFRCIDELVEYEVEHQRELEGLLEEAEQRLRIVDGICQEYESVFYMDGKTGEGMPYVLNSCHLREEHFNLYEKFSFYECMKYYISDHVWERDREMLWEHIQPELVCEELKKADFYTVNYRVDNRENILHYQLRIVRLGDEQEQVWAFRNVDSIVKDELERKERLRVALKNAKQAERAKTEFLSNMSHDIRTPMNAILGFHEIAIENIEDKARVADALGKASSAGKHMLDIINHVLDMAHIESGKMELGEECVDVKQRVPQIESMFRVLMDQKGIEFEVIDETKVRYIIGDDTRLTQVFSNLLSNAIKFTPKGGKITYHIIDRPAEDGWVECEVHVKDTGIGMSAEFQRNLYNAFERERSATQSGVQGTGLGLSIAKGIVELMGGTVTCKSELGKGTEFIVIFKARIATVEPKDALRQQEDLNVLEGKRLLLVEDNDLNREIAISLLSAKGCIVEEAEDGTVAVDKVLNSAPGYYDAILMDIQMPIMDGYKATAEIRAIENRALANIPIIAMTANAFEEDRKRAFRVGMDEHVAKPIDINKLTEVISRLVK